MSDIRKRVTVEDLICGRKPSRASLMSLAARCGLRGLGVKDPGPAAIAEVNTNMQPPPINQLINNLTSSCCCLLNDMRRLPEIPFRCGLCVAPLLWQPRYPRVLDVRQATRHFFARDTLSWFPDIHTQFVVTCGFVCGP